MRNSNGFQKAVLCSLLGTLPMSLMPVCDYFRSLSSTGHAESVFITSRRKGFHLTSYVKTAGAGYWPFGVGVVILSRRYKNTGKFPKLLS